MSKAGKVLVPLDQTVRSGREAAAWLVGATAEGCSSPVMAHLPQERIAVVCRSCSQYNYLSQCWV